MKHVAWAGYEYVELAAIQGMTEHVKIGDDTRIGPFTLILDSDYHVPGNPTAGSPVWTLGHRNVQGLAWDASGRMWASEFGQNTWDELNHIVAGDNYGWPVVEGRGHRAQFHDPVRVWHTDVASPSEETVTSIRLWSATASSVP